MGTIIKAECNCGYKTKNLFYGAGMEDFMNVANVPALKNGSSEIEMINIKKKNQYPEYSFYTDKLLASKPNNSRSIDHFDLKLHQQNNLCPKCKNYTLNFVEVGMFD